ncbi:MAG: hypothetical protein LBD03_06240 [Methanobrevibacter sp.]|jgi:hypothetical protein|nr:hypothetical protein [Candidatus Methanovirga procula]
MDPISVVANGGCGGCVGCGGCGACGVCAVPIIPNPGYFILGAVAVGFAGFFGFW